ncbi:MULTISPECIES: MFS transporter [Hymenobacter]|uniref:Predicted arabinose efflux permease, MFS family n=1 Tax=Hymenobacter psychrotolerans DSM 18569 TaxID=1121959 RepID=A0A1M6ZTC8_9BACT|nr:MULTISPECIES: MFS transporter [Hymenobacter]QNE42128.1 MFS transporter [Hymenobacter sp. NBH84]SHL33605.1 Predicted arabinose efflux permease, MFS family [Hymenobacter psychrotolerans DSM 18569]
MTYLTRAVWLLSLISLFTDLASEMLYPVMPLYLQSIGFSVFFIGLLEGLAEAVAGLSKGYFGQWSDRLGRRVPFVQWGYGLSAFSKPMLSVLATPLWVLLARTLDRLGKGLRTGARDALLSDETTPADRGKVFGFHRSMDTLGAVFGPLAALAWLAAHPGQYRPLFLWAFLPGALAVGITFALRERRAVPSGRPVMPFWASFRYWRQAPPAYRRVVGSLLVFALFNSADAFLLLLARQRGVSATGVIGLYVLYNFTYVLSAWPLGHLADRLGPRRLLVGGLLIFAVVYGGVALAQGPWVFAGFFALYGLYAAATEGVSKAWVSTLCAPADTGAALGTLGGLSSLAALGASTSAGLLWQWGGPALPFGLAAAVALGVAAFLARR